MAWMRPPSLRNRLKSRFRHENCQNFLIRGRRTKAYLSKVRRGRLTKEQEILAICSRNGLFRRFLILNYKKRSSKDLLCFVPYNYKCTPIGYSCILSL